MQTIAILGRQPALGLAELESLYRARKVRLISRQAALLDVEPEHVQFARLGGSVKAARVLAEIDGTDWKKLERSVIAAMPEHAARLPEGKLIIGLSAYGLAVSPGKLNALGLSIKKAIRKASGRPVRLVPNNEAELSSAQVYHNHLADAGNWELLLVRDGSRTLLAQTFAVQDIDSYTLRDRGRPKRDARVGMLPPKLAQIIINLASGPITDYRLPITGATTTQTARKQVGRGTDTSNTPSATFHLTPTILDPFCGTGVLLQEALLMDYAVYGSDLEARMIDYARANLDWLTTKFQIPDSKFLLEQADATTHRWSPTPTIVACETYLGRPFTTSPRAPVLAQTISEVDLILKKFLRNIHAQLAPGTRLCLAVPAWNLQPINDSRLVINGTGHGHNAAAAANVNRQSSIVNRFKHLPFIDSLEELGYNRVSFEHARNDRLLYYREDQIVARQLLVLQTIKD